MNSIQKKVQIRNIYIYIYISIHNTYIYIYISISISSHNKNDKERCLNFLLDLLCNYCPGSCAEIAIIVWRLTHPPIESQMNTSRGNRNKRDFLTGDRGDRKKK